MFRQLPKIGFIFAIAVLSIASTRPTSAQTGGVNRPFGLPFAAPPGPGTWLVGQQYGNTNGAYNFGPYWYAAGQGLHFGIDLSAPCGTPIVAIGDGVVDFTDNFSHGSAPHNLAIVHRDQQLISFYGHLLKRPDLTRGQPVKKGEVIAMSGDPDSTCISRPHLHLEIRSMNYKTAYNPVALIDADWAMLSSFGYQGRFTKDLYHPNRWQSADDQPAINFGDRLINAYQAAWPPKQRIAPAHQTAPAFSAPPLAERAPTFIRLTDSGCCSMAWWAPGGSAIRYFDGPDDQFASTQELSVDSLAIRTIDWLSPASESLNSQYKIGWKTNGVEIRANDGKSAVIATSGTWPTFSPNATRVLWQRFPGDPVPGTLPPQTEVWVSNVNGTDRNLITLQAGGSVMWLDDDRILLIAREGITLYSKMSIYDLRSKTVTALFRAENVRAVSVEPGGAHISFGLIFQKDDSANGLYTLETTADAKPQKLPFFGSMRWRGAGKIVYIPFAMKSSMTLVEYELESGKSRAITEPDAQPFRILNDEWSISPTGKQILYWDEADRALWLVTLPT